MYTRFRIQNFKGFKDLEFDDLARVNLIAGKNNTGKTSVLEAVEAHTSTNYQLTQRILPRQIRDESEIKYPDWGLLFNGFQSNTEIILDADFSQPNQYTSKSATTKIRITDSNNVAAIFNIINIRSKRQGEVGWENDQDHMPILEIEYLFGSGDNLKTAKYHVAESGNQASSHGFDFDPFDVTFVSANLPNNPRTNANRFSRLDIAGDTDILISTLKIIDPRVEVIKILYEGEPPLLYANLRDLERPIPLKMLGEGIQRMATLILAMGNAKNGILLIDEIENGLHHSVLPDVWRAIYAAAEQLNVQVFATTHSYEAIQAAHKVFSETDDYDFRLHRLDRQDDNEITHVTYDQSTLQTALEFNMEVR